MAERIQECYHTSQNTLGNASLITVALNGSTDNINSENLMVKN